LNRKKNVQYYIGLSFIGVFLILFLSYFGPDGSGTIAQRERHIIGGAFIVSCLYGITLAVKPNWRRKLSRSFTSQTESSTKRNDTRERRGHHPDCDNFKEHVIVTKDRTYCSGCLGLAMGSFISIMLMSLYILYPTVLEIIHPWVGIILGLLFILFNYLEIFSPARSTGLHLISNVFLIIGFFLIVFGVVQLTTNPFYGLIGIIFSFLWLDVRIQLSNYHHQIICQECEKSCKAY